MEENEVWTATKRVMGALRLLTHEQAMTVLESCRNTVAMSAPVPQEQR